jgi:hypothetical protein
VIPYVAVTGKYSGNEMVAISVNDASKLEDGIKHVSKITQARVYHEAIFVQHYTHDVWQSSHGDV